MQKEQLRREIAEALACPSEGSRDALRLVLKSIVAGGKGNRGQLAGSTEAARTGEYRDRVVVSTEEINSGPEPSGIIYFGTGTFEMLRATKALRQNLEPEEQSRPKPLPQEESESAQEDSRLAPLQHRDTEHRGWAAAATEGVDPLEDTGTTSLQAILDNVKEAILTVDPYGRLLSTNPGAERVFASSEDAMQGRNIGELIPSLTRPSIALESLARRLGDTLTDMAPQVIEAQRADGTAFTAEITVSRAQHGRTFRYVLCLRDVTDRLQGEQALRDSEARYRTLVENAPEAIVVLDVAENRFVDANENAARLFKLSREELLEIGPEAISPERQADGLPSFGLSRGYLDRALKGGCPVFEWTHKDSQGGEIPCEVRFIRLPSSERELIRASIIDITARKKAEILAYGERRVLELVASNASLEKTLLAVARVMERIHPHTYCALMLLDEGAEKIALRASGELPAPLKEALMELPVGLRAGACGAAASLGRQVVVRDMERDALWGELREAVQSSGVAACCSTPIVTAGDRIHGTLDVYFADARGPQTDELDLMTRLTQLAGIAIRRKQDELDLRASEARFRALFDNVVDGVFQTTPEGDLLSANPALLRMLGYESGEALKQVGKVAHHYVDPKDRERLVQELNTNGRVRNFEYQLRSKDGKVIAVLENSRVVRDSRGKMLYYEGTVTDITQRKVAERALFREKERAQVTLKSIGDAVVTTDAHGRVDYLNPVAEELTGWEHRQARGREITEIVRLVHEETGEPAENPVLRCLEEGRVVGLTDNVGLLARDGIQIAIQDSAAPIQDRSGQVVGAVMVFHDSSKERRLHRKLSYYASHDSLTGLINRREFEERLSAALRAVQEDEETADHAVLYMDLDQFKVINDTCGHTAGDLLLRQLGDLLQSRVRGSDVLARLGGDEFAVLLPHCSVTEAVKVADDLREAISEFRFDWHDGSLRIGVSIGVVPISPESETVGSLLSAADVACYVAKDLGRNRIHVYEEGDAAERHKEMKWVARINKAREEDRLELFYQPIVPIGDSREANPQYELLLRMRDEHGLILPRAFIPAAERYNLMPALDRWVVTQALGLLAYRGQAEEEPYTLAINLSGSSLNDMRFLDFLLGELNAAALPHGAICFEITETSAIANLSHVVHFMRTLKDRGCQFSLDDFGSGLSSLTYLKNLPVDYVKIDGQFIRNVAHDPADGSMVEAIARMARALRIQTIAERVETRAVLDRLAEIGVSYAQGFYIAVPQSVKELPVRSGRRKVTA